MNCCVYLKGNRKYILDFIVWKPAITETEKAKRESDKIELQKLENEIMKLGYDY